MTAQGLERCADICSEHTTDSDLDTLTESLSEQSAELQQFSGFGVLDGDCGAYELDSRGGVQPRFLSPPWEEYIDFLEC